MLKTLKELLADSGGGIDDAFGLMIEVTVFTIVFAFAGSLVLSGTAQVMSAIVAHHVAGLVAAEGPDSLVARQEAQNDAQAYLDARGKPVAIVSSLSQCGTAAACVAISTCSSSSPVCLVTVQRRVTIPVVNSAVTWTAKAVSLRQQNA